MYKGKPKYKFKKLFLFAESLAEEPEQEFNPHPEVGRHFKTFTGTRYIPNEFLQARYPEDM